MSRPHVICHMQVSLDGRIHPSRWTASPDGTRSDWSELYEEVHGRLDGDAWLVGRVTMAEMSKAAAHPPQDAAAPERPHHLVRREGATYALAVDPGAKLHFDKPDIGGDPVVVLLGRDTPDSHLAELAADGVSYIVAEDDFDLRPLLDAVTRELSVRRLLLEGGGHVNGAFLAAGLVDEISLLMAPAIDGGEGVTGAFDAGVAGLAGKARLSLSSVERLTHGVVHLRYAVEPG